MRLVFVLVWVLTAVLSGLALYLLWAQNQSAGRAVLEQKHSAQVSDWHDILRRNESRILAELERTLLSPELLSVLAQAQATSPSADIPPTLERRLHIAVAALRGPELVAVQVLAPDGSILLSVNGADGADSAWGGLRAEHRLALESSWPVTGFELGPRGLKWRLIAPLQDERSQVLGIVIVAYKSDRLFAELERLRPEGHYKVLIRRAMLDSITDAPDRIPMRSWSASPLFLLTERSADFSRSASGSGQAGQVALLREAMTASADLRGRLANSVHEPFRLTARDRDFVMLPMPLSDSAGRSLGLILAAVPEPTLTALDSGFGRHAAFLLSMFLLLGSITHRLLQVADARAAERRRSSLITQSLAQGLYVLDSAGVVTEVNVRACALLGYESAELIGRKAEELFHLPADNAPSGGSADSAPATRVPDARYCAEQLFRRKDGSPLHVALNCIPLPEEDGSLNLFDDITQQKLQEGQLKQIAHFDALTGLPNRVLLADRLAAAMRHARGSGRRLALAFIDLDGFKAINDNFGHDIGDRLLVRLGRRMQTVVRDSDTVARLGGDEFAVVLTDIQDVDSVALMLSRLLAAIAQPELIDAETMQVSGSIGVSLYPQSEEIGADQLLRQADQAMYEAKLAGKRCYRVFDPDHHADLRGRNERLERLRLAISRSELRLYYQPCINLATGSLQTVEALLRWQHPDHGLLPPAAFLPWIKRDELEIEIGRWVLRTALRQIDQWRQQGLRVAVSVNIAGEHLQHPGFVDELTQELAAWPDVRPQQLQLEIVESSALENIDEVRAVIAACSRLGVRVALDDFGTGYSSLSYLRRLPVHLLKLDRSFVDGMLNDTEDLTIVDGVLRLARAFNMQVLAEGVETPEQWRMLARLGCELAQGFCVARPMPPSGLEQWLKDWSRRAEWANVKPLSNEQRDVLYGLVEHRAWLRSLRSFLERPEGAQRPERPGAGGLNKRLKSVLARRAYRASYRDVLHAYQRTQDLAEDAINQRLEAGLYAAMQRWPEVEQVSEELQSLLEDMLEAKA